MTLSQKISTYIQTSRGDFNQLALEVFAHQYERCLPYQRYCRQLHKTPEQVSTWQQVPAVSTEVFREFDLCTLPPEEARYIFLTSGTSQETKGKHYYHDLTLYDAAIQASFLLSLGLSETPKILFRILTPSFAEVPTSSLFYMFQQILTWYGAPGSRFYFKENELDCALLAADLREDTAANRPVVLLGTAFAFVNFCDYLKAQDHAFKLPQTSKLLETGGLKGRVRAVSRTELYQLFTSYFGLDLQSCFSEYSMTELSSQCYSQANSPLFYSPPWMPTQVINPETGTEVGIGETGLVQFFDLANLTAISAIITADLARKHPQGFELLGRAPKAILRGCSTAFEIQIIFPTGNESPRETKGDPRASSLLPFGNPLAREPAASRGVNSLNKLESSRCTRNSFKT